MAIEQIRQNIKALMEVEGLKDKQLSLEAGLGGTAIRDLMDRNPNPGYFTIYKIAKRLGTTPDALAGLEAPAGRKQRGAHSLAVPEIDVRVEGGVGAELDATLDGQGVHRVVSEWAIPADYLRAHTSAPGELRILRVAGESMEPEYPAGERVLVDHSHKNPSPPGLYVLWDGFGLIIKRLELLAGNPPRVRISSSHPAYPPYERDIADIQINGRVIGKWTWK